MKKISSFLAYVCKTVTLCYLLCLETLFVTYAGKKLTFFFIFPKVIKTMPRLNTETTSQTTKKHNNILTTKICFSNVKPLLLRALRGLLGFPGVEEIEWILLVEGRWVGIGKGEIRVGVERMEGENMGRDN